MDSETRQAGFRERQNQSGPEEHEGRLSFGVSPVQHADDEESRDPSMGIPAYAYAAAARRSSSTDSTTSSNSSFAASSSSSESSSDSAQMRHSNQSPDTGEDSTVALIGLSAQLLEASMSRKQGWLPLPPAKPGNTDDDSDSSEFSNPSNDAPNFLSSGSPTKSGSLGTSFSDSPPRKRTYELKVEKLNYKLPPPKQTALAKLKNLIKATPKGIDDDNELSSKTNGDRYILRNISFEAKPGELLAIAGSSGAGKSTILECLAGRVKPSSPAGCILVNNQIMSASTFRRISGYVMQDDALFPTLTVFETLLISARLRLPNTMTMSEKLLRVQSVMGELGLQHAANTRIGNDMIRGVSGGERRRVSIGIDVIHDPAVLILDEPTSGLDSGAALNVIAMLRAMAGFRGRTVILSIHQPSFRILQLMHSVLLVAGGMVVHHGSLEHLASRLASAGHQVPARTTVLEYAIDAVNSWKTEDLMGRNYAAIAKGLAQAQQQQQMLVQLDKHFHRNDTVLVDLEQGLGGASEVVNGSSPGGSDNDHDDDKQISYPNNIFQETTVLTERFFKNILRTKELFGARSLQALAAGVILGTVFLNVDDDRQGVADRFGFFVFTLSFLLNSTTEALPIFLQERQILMRETSRGAYRVISHVLSHALVFVPFLLAIAILYGVPSYWLTGLTSSMGNFMFYCLSLWLTLLLANSFVSFFSALVPNYIMGQALVGAFMGAFFLFSGYVINRNSIPKYWIWMHYISLFKYPFNALLLNEFGDHERKCYEYQALPGYGGGESICTLTGSQVLHNAGVEGHRKWMDVVAILGFILFYRILCYFTVRWRLNQRQR